MTRTGSKISALCKKCGKCAVNSVIKCPKCESTFHLSCYKSYKGINEIDEANINFFEEEQHNEQEFWDAVTDIAPNKSCESIFRYIIKQKDFAIEQQKTLIGELNRKVKYLEDQLRDLKETQANNLLTMDNDKNVIATDKKRTISQKLVVKENNTKTPTTTTTTTLQSTTEKYEERQFRLRTNAKMQEESSATKISSKTKKPCLWNSPCHADSHWRQQRYFCSSCQKKPSVCREY